MNERVKHVAIAVAVIVLDAEVLERYGGVLWKAAFRTAWIELGLVILTSALAFSLACIWSRLAGPLQWQLQPSPPSTGSTNVIEEENNV